MFNLYELAENLKAVESLICQDTEEGATPDEILIKALDECQGALTTKVCNIGAWVKNLESEAEAIRIEEGKLAIRRKSKEALQERLKAWVLKNIKAGSKFEDSRCQVWTHKSTHCEIEDATKIPTEYIRTKITQEPAKDEIKKVLAKGGQVPGARLV